jgi:hypothetical protein
MNPLWSLLARINARYLAIGAGTLLAVAAVGWLTALPAPRTPDEFFGPRPVTTAAQADVEAAAAWTARPADAPPNPFLSNHLSELVALSDEGLLRWDTPSPAPRGTLPEPPPAEEAPEPAEVRTLTLIYRGMMTRTDGSLVAMIENLEGGRLTTYPLGGRLGDARVTGIQRGLLELTAGKKTFTLPRGRQETLEY